jgi:DedD protein
MATSASPEASDLKRRGRQRLIGAVALVALLVVFVPMLLDSNPRPAKEGPALDIPSKDGAKPLPAPATPAKAGAQTEPEKVAAQMEPSKPAPTPAPPEPSKPAAAPAQVAAAPPKPAEPTPIAKTEPPRTGFAVQVGAFRDEAKLKQARDKLAAARIAHYTERLDGSGGGLTRLRAGPFQTREAAEGALATLRRSSLDGKVVPLP